MIVAMNRQELEKATERKVKHKKSHTRRKKKSISLAGSAGAPVLSEIILRGGNTSVFIMALVLFLIICGLDMPYSNMAVAYVPGLKTLEIPDNIMMESLDIKTLRADAGIQTPERQPVDKTILWDIPSFTYVINKGDTISQISRQYHTSLSTILSVNKIDNVKKMSPGQVLVIPELEGILYTCSKDDTVESLLEDYKIERAELIQHNPYIYLENGDLVLNSGQEVFIPGVRIPEENLREQMGELFIFPVQGSVIKGYGNIVDSLTQIESFHNGIDIKGNSGDAVKASLDGRVIAVGFNSSYGNYVILEHAGGYRSLYAQLEKSNVNRNDKVLQGEIIANVGVSGYAREAHLHFSLFKGKKSIDPLDFLH